MALQEYIVFGQYFNERMLFISRPIPELMECSVAESHNILYIPCLVIKWCSSDCASLNKQH